MAAWPPEGLRAGARDPSLLRKPLNPGGEATPLFYASKMMPTKKKILYSLLSLTILITTLELTLRLFNYPPLSKTPGKNYWTPNFPLVNRCENDIRDAGWCAAQIAEQATTAKKLIVVFGGSSVYGYPHTPEYSFPNLLQKKLQDADYTEFKVINAGSPCKDSWYIRACFEKIIEAGIFPHTAVIYEGHNDMINVSLIKTDRNLFLKNNPWFYTLLFFLEDHSSVYAAAALLNKYFQGDSPQELELDDATFAENTKKLTTATRKNLEDFLKRASTHKVRTFLITAASNLYDKEPFHPETSNRTGALHFRKGRTYLLAHQHEKAYDEFILARDSSRYTQRASTSMNNVFRELSKEWPDTQLIDLEHSIRDRYMKSSIGCNLFGDATYCDFHHPNKLLKQVMADDIFNAFKNTESIFR